MKNLMHELTEDAERRTSRIQLGGIVSICDLLIVQQQMITNELLLRILEKK